MAVVLIKTRNPITIEVSIYSQKVLYMDKRSYIISILQKLKSYRPIAEGILALIESTYCNDQTIDVLLKMLRQGVKQVTTRQGQEKFQKAIELVQKIKHTEEQEDKNKEMELDAMLNTI